MPVVTAWLFAAAGLALAASHAEQPRPGGRVVGRVVAGVACLSLALLPARVFVSQRALRDGARAFAAGSCDVAVDRALDAVDAFNIRPEPFIVLGYCDVRLGRPALAVRAMQSAVRKIQRTGKGITGWRSHRRLGGEIRVFRCGPRCDTTRGTVFWYAREICWAMSRRTGRDLRPNSTPGPVTAAGAARGLRRPNRRAPTAGAESVRQPCRVAARGECEGGSWHRRPGPSCGHIPHRG